MTSKFIYYLLIFFPLSLVIGPFLSDTIVVISAIFFIYILYEKKLWDWLKSKVSVTVIIFWLYCSIRSILSEQPLLSLESSLFYIRFLFFALTFCYVFQKYVNFKKYFGISLLTTLFIVALDGYFQYFFNFNFLGYNLENPSRITGLFRDEAVIGSYLSRLLPLAIFFIFLNFKEKNFFLIVTYFFSIFIVVLIFISGERAAFFYSMLTICSLFLLNQNFKKHFFIIFIILCTIIITLVFSITQLKSRMIDQTINELGINNVSENLYIFTSIHQNHYYSAYLMFKDNILFGQGPKMFRELCKLEKYNPKGCSTHPHNSYMQLLAEVGLMGTLIVLSVFLIIVYYLTKQLLNIFFYKDKKILDIENIMLLICFVITLWPLIPTGSFFNNWLNCIFYLPLGIYLARNNIFKLDVTKI